MVTRVSDLEFVEERLGLGPLLIADGSLDLDNGVRMLAECGRLGAGDFAAAVDRLGDTLQQSDGLIEAGLERLRLLSVAFEPLLQNAGAESQQGAHGRRGERERQNEPDGLKRLTEKRRDGLCRREENGLEASQDSGEGAERTEAPNRWRYRVRRGRLGPVQGRGGRAAGRRAAGRRALAAGCP